MNKDEYPANWPEIAYRVKEKAGWKCERCGHPHDPSTGHTLTAAHLDHDKSNCADWNLAALCQRCHLHFANMTLLQLYKLSHQSSFFGVSHDWLKPHMEGIIQALKQKGGEN